MFDFTIITPSYNQGIYLEETIISVLNQTDVNIQFLIVDGASTDNSIDLLRKYADKIDWWVSEKDNGQSHAINKGLLKTKGKYVNWLNSDDFLQVECLKYIKKAFEDNYDVFAGRSNIIVNGKTIRSSSGTDVYKNNLPKTIGQARIDQPETWWRTSVIEHIGPLNEDLHYIMDRDWWIRYLLTYGADKVLKSEEIVANFRIHEHSKTSALSSRFNQERNSYYAALASSYGLHENRVFIESLSRTEKLTLRFMPDQVDLNMLNDAYNYYYLLLADEYYASGDHHSVKKLIKTIDPSSFDDADKRQYDLLKFRSKLPASLITFIRKVR